ncbi:hypothetical protein ACP4OV_013066 [Aristida adscensionis]
MKNCSFFDYQARSRAWPKLSAAEKRAPNHVELYFSDDDVDKTLDCRGRPEGRFGRFSHCSLWNFFDFSLVCQDMDVHCGCKKSEGFGDDEEFFYSPNGEEPLPYDEEELDNKIFEKINCLKRRIGDSFISEAGGNELQNQQQRRCGRLPDAELRQECGDLDVDAVVDTLLQSRTAP